MRFAFRPFSGRINRQTFIIGNIFYYFIGIIIKIFIFTPLLEPYYIYVKTHAKTISTIELISAIILLLALYFMVFALPHLTLYSKRFHDLGESGIEQFILLIPFIGLYYWVRLIIKSGQPGSNHYGPQPSPIVNAFSIVGFQTSLKGAEPPPTDKTNQTHVQTTEEKLMQIFTLTNYSGDKEALIKEFIIHAEKQALTELLTTLSAEKQIDLKKDLGQELPPERVRELLVFYFGKDIYEPPIHQIIDKKLAEHLQKVVPNLSEEQRKKLEEYMASF